MGNKVSNSPWYDSLQQLKSEIFKGLRVCLPGTIDSIDPTSYTATINVGVMQSVPMRGIPTGLPVEYPQLTNCPIVSMQGGGAGFVAPPKEGDACLVVFSDRCIDLWFTNNGAVVPLPSFRMHDIADGFAIVGLNVLKPDGTTTLKHPLAIGEVGLCQTNTLTGAKVAVDTLTGLVDIANGPGGANSLRVILSGMVTTLATLSAPTGATSLIKALLDLISALVTQNTALLAATCGGNHFDATTLAALAAVGTQLTTAQSEVNAASAAAVAGTGASATAIPSLLT